jgi:hypothetical protein
VLAVARARFRGGERLPTEQHEALVAVAAGVVGIAWFEVAKHFLRR